MVPLDLPPLIKGSSNEYRVSGRRKLGQMDASSKKMIVVWLIEKRKKEKKGVIKRKERGEKEKKKRKKEWWSEYQYLGDLVQDLDSNL